MDTRQLTHPQLPITAPAYMWQAMGFETYANTDTIPGSLRCRSGEDRANRLLAMAAAKGISGETALIF